MLNKERCFPKRRWQEGGLEPPSLSLLHQLRQSLHHGNDRPRRNAHDHTKDDRIRDKGSARLFCDITAAQSMKSIGRKVIGFA